MSGGRTWAQILLLVLALLPGLAGPARAVDEQVGECVCREALSRILCKPDAELNYIGRQDEKSFVFNVFYGSKNANFVCAFYEDGGRGTVLVTSKIWLRERRSLDFTLDRRAGCAEGRVANPACPRKPFKCCRSLTPDEAATAHEDSFWYRPMPKGIMHPSQLGGVPNSTAGTLNITPPDPRQLFPAGNLTLPEEPPAERTPTPADTSTATKPPAAKPPAAKLPVVQVPVGQAPAVQVPAGQAPAAKPGK